MKFLESLILGFVSGLTEFLPISSAAHRQIICAVFGTDASDPARNLFIHIAIFLAAYINTAKKRERLDRAYKNQSGYMKKGSPTGSAVMEYRLLRLAVISFMIVFLLLYYLIPVQANLFSVSICLLVNGLIIYWPDRMMQGNKNAKVMSAFESILLGIAGALCVFPGFSRIGFMFSIATLCGAERRSSVNWALLLSLWALGALVLTDLLALFSEGGAPFWSNFIYYIITAFFSFIGACAGLHILRKSISKKGCAGFSYYCWGAAIFALIIFLTVS